MRLSRPCYDKFHRCPGWIGGGIKFPKDDVLRCDGGRIAYPGGKLSKFKFSSCDTCDVVTLPWVIRYVDPQNLIAEVKYIYNVKSRYMWHDFIDWLKGS